MFGQKKKYISKICGGSNNEGANGIRNDLYISDVYSRRLLTTLDSPQRSTYNHPPFGELEPYWVNVKQTLLIRNSFDSFFDVHIPTLNASLPTRVPLIRLLILEMILSDMAPTIPSAVQSVLDSSLSHHDSFSTRINSFPKHSPISFLDKHVDEKYILKQVVSIPGTGLLTDLLDFANDLLESVEKFPRNRRGAALPKHTQCSVSNEDGEADVIARWRDVVGLHHTSLFTRRPLSGATICLGSRSRMVRVIQIHSVFHLLEHGWKGDLRRNVSSLESDCSQRTQLAVWEISASTVASDYLFQGIQDFAQEPTEPERKPFLWKRPNIRDHRIQHPPYSHYADAIHTPWTLPHVYLNLILNEDLSIYAGETSKRDEQTSSRDFLTSTPSVIRPVVGTISCQHGSFPEEITEIEDVPRNISDWAQDYLQRDRAQRQEIREKKHPPSVETRGNKRPFNQVESDHRPSMAQSRQKRRRSNSSDPLDPIRNIRPSTTASLKERCKKLDLAISYPRLLSEERSVVGKHSSHYQYSHRIHSNPVYGLILGRESVVEPPTMHIEVSYIESKDSPYILVTSSAGVSLAELQRERYLASDGTVTIPNSFQFMPLVFTIGTYIVVDEKGRVSFIDFDLARLYVTGRQRKHERKRLLKLLNGEKVDYDRTTFRDGYYCDDCSPGTCQSVSEWDSEEEFVRARSEPLLNPLNLI
ncbi:hypothetical protein EV360DRAFT_75869 [Lentinula raphanica]|nr:hypothetical protein EV360DRAFT_75869 [Lentinula raphanica]